MTFPFARGPKILEDTPGLSNTFDNVIFASSLEKAIPLTVLFSNTLFSSVMTVPDALGLIEDLIYIIVETIHRALVLMN